MTTKNTTHYYGELVRGIFLFSGIVMLATYPFFSDLIEIPLVLFFSIIIGLVLVGGIINPVSKWIFFFSTLIPLVGLIVFMYYGFYTYQNLPTTHIRNVVFFWTNQGLALLFFFATYFSVKTLRGMYVKHLEE